MVTRVTREQVDAGELPPPPADLGDLAGLAAEADQVEGRAPGADVAPPAEATPAPTDYAGEAREVVELAGSILLPFVAHRWGQEVADLYGTQQRAKIADALARVAQKRGWSVGALMEGWGPELMLCAAIAGPVLPRLIAAAAPPPPPTRPDQPAELATADDAPAPPHAGNDGRVL